MIGLKRLLRVYTVVSIAVATGHTVETLRAASAPSGDLSALAASVTAEPTARGAALPQSASLGAVNPGDLPPLVGITSVSAAADDRAPGACAPTLALMAGDAATIEVALVAPCDPGERVVIRHAGLSFTSRTGPDGRLSLQLPALEAEALVAAYFEGSEVALARLSVPGMEDKLRFAVQMAEPVQFELRADEAGQVLAAGSATSNAGRIAALGDASVMDAMLAQVYTFPAASLTDGSVTVEVRITPETCSRTFPAETVTSIGGKALRSGLSVAVPLCGTAGDILVLKNLVQDPTLAAHE